jgi:signal transduction histidine kinase
VLSYDRGVIVLYRQKGFEAVSKLDTQGGSRMIVGRARDVLKAFTQDEQKLLQERDAREQADTHNAARLFIFGSALAASLLIFASWMTSREMSRRQRVEWERERALKDAENARHAALAATEAKSNFLSNMSHEIRTPLNGMVGAAEVLGETPLSAEQREYLGILTSECEGLRRLVNDILDLSKLEADRVKFEETEFEVRELIKKVCQNLRPHADGKGLALIDEVAPDVEGFRIGDPYRIRQILLNLVSNAIKFTASGSVTARVTNGPDDRVRFSVVDTGIGIPPEQQRELFGRFAQANVSVTRQYGGSGLGLSIVKSLVERMQGRV